MRADVLVEIATAGHRHEQHAGIDNPLQERGKGIHVHPDGGRLRGHAQLQDAAHQAHEEKEQGHRHVAGAALLSVARSQRVQDQDQQATDDQDDLRQDVNQCTKSNVQNRPPPPLQDALDEFK